MSLTTRLIGGSIASAIILSLLFYWLFVFNPRETCGPVWAVRTLQGETYYMSEYPMPSIDKYYKLPKNNGKVLVHKNMISSIKRIH